MKTIFGQNGFWKVEIFKKWQKCKKKLKIQSFLMPKMGSWTSLRPFTRKWLHDEIWSYPILAEKFEKMPKSIFWRKVFEKVQNGYFHRNLRKKNLKFIFEGHPLWIFLWKSYLRTHEFWKTKFLMSFLANIRVLVCIYIYTTKKMKKTRIFFPLKNVLLRHLQVGYWSLLKKSKHFLRERKFIFFALENVQWWEVIENSTFLLRSTLWKNGSLKVELTN